MYNFTTMIMEALKRDHSEVLTNKDIENFLSKTDKMIPTKVKNIIYLTSKYNLLDKESIDDIMNSSKSSLKKLSDIYSIPEDEIEGLWKALKELKSNINLLPQYMSEVERDMFMDGKLSMDDITLDLNTNAGRNEAAKKYTRLAYTIVNQYLGKSSLSKSDLISAAMLGLTGAMNDWDKSKNVPFKTYAGTRMRQQILNDINAHSHALSGFSDYALKKGYNADALSIDALTAGDEDYDTDKLKFLGIADDEYKELDEKEMKPLFDLLEKNFSARDVDIFYRYFMLKGNKKEKSKDIAKFYGMSEGNIRNSVINKILKFLRTDKKANNILSQLQESYNINMMVGLIGLNESEILDVLMNDDIYLLLEDMNRWGDKKTFEYVVKNALESIDKSSKQYIIDVLKRDFEYLDSTFKKNKKILISFLSHIHQTEPINSATDVTLLDFMEELQEAYRKYLPKL